MNNNPAYARKDNEIVSAHARNRRLALLLAMVVLGMYLYFILINIKTI